MLRTTVILLILAGFSHLNTRAQDSSAPNLVENLSKQIAKEIAEYRKAVGKYSPLLAAAGEARDMDKTKSLHAELKTISDKYAVSSKLLYARLRDAKKAAKTSEKPTRRVVNRAEWLRGRWVSDDDGPAFSLYLAANGDAAVHGIGTPALRGKTSWDSRKVGGVLYLTIAVRSEAAGTSESNQYPVIGKPGSVRVMLENYFGTSRWVKKVQASHSNSSPNSNVPPGKTFTLNDEPRFHGYWIEGTKDRYWEPISFREIRPGGRIRIVRRRPERDLGPNMSFSVDNRICFFKGDYGTVELSWGIDNSGQMLVAVLFNLGRPQLSTEGLSFRGENGEVTSTWRRPTRSELLRIKSDAGKDYLLRIAIKEGNRATIKKLIQQGADPGYLGYLTDFGKAANWDLLDRHIVNPTLRLLAALKYCDMKLFKSAIEQGGRIDLVGQGGESGRKSIYTLKLLPIAVWRGASAIQQNYSATKLPTAATSESPIHEFSYQALEYLVSTSKQSFYHLLVAMMARNRESHFRIYGNEYLASVVRRVGSNLSLPEISDLMERSADSSKRPGSNETFIGAELIKLSSPTKK